jgi:hypothetical protein
MKLCANDPEHLHTRAIDNVEDVRIFVGVDADSGTDLVWPVYELNGKPLEPLDGNRYPHVCRHQIVAGD